MDWKCSRCDVPHRAQIAGFTYVVFQAAGQKGGEVCIARGHADNLDDRRACLKVLDGLEVLDGHKELNDFEVVNRS